MGVTPACRPVATMVDRAARRPLLPSPAAATIFRCPSPCTACAVALPGGVFEPSRSTQRATPMRSRTVQAPAPAPQADLLAPPHLAGGPCAVIALWLMQRAAVRDLGCAGRTALSALRPWLSGSKHGAGSRCEAVCVCWPVMYITHLGQRPSHTRRVGGMTGRPYS